MVYGRVAIANVFGFLTFNFAYLLHSNFQHAALQQSIHLVTYILYQAIGHYLAVDRKALYAPVITLLRAFLKKSRLGVPNLFIVILTYNYTGYPVRIRKFSKR